MNPLKTNPIAIFIVLIWVVEAINMVSGHALAHLGILPRTFMGLFGIPLSPLLHANLFHLISNTVPLIVLAAIVSLQGRKQLYQLTLWIIFVGGFCVWLFARASYHNGASGLVFGLFGYLIGCAWFGRDVKAIIQATLVGFLYGGLIFGVFPTVRQHISWEAHLFGMLAGFVGAKLFYRVGNNAIKKSEPTE
ncbi:MAG: rhomboid family intramembrane serine protease [Mariprofundaceae bacterium]|nr:rhomboid family intramembrane serine protease [Mariprofundaceae bacterium]